MQERPNPYLNLGGSAEGERAARTCDHAGCHGEGRFRAPRSPDRLRDYYWFCLDHVRAYNARWNYFAHMTGDDIDRYRRNDAGWQRPTWKMGGGSNAHNGGRMNGTDGIAGIHIHDPLDIFANLDFGATRYADPGPTGKGYRPLSPDDRAALDRLGLDGNASMADIKKTYKQLVKQYHPDANGGDRSGEDLLKAISAAYRHLGANWPSP